MRVSVIVPVYNVEQYLERCMQSIFSQAETLSSADMEIILVDDGSTDSGGVICDRYAETHAAVQVIHQENAGLGMARNSGLQAAKGDYVFFMDSDDYIGPGLLENLCCAAKEQDADICIGGFTMISPTGEKIPRASVKEACSFAGEGIRELMLNTAGSLPEEEQDSKYGLSVWSRLYRRSILEDYGIRFVSERELISEDLIFNLDFLRYAKKAVVTADTGYFYCYNGGSLSKKHCGDRFQRDCELYEAVKERLEGLFEEEEYARYLQRMLISRARFDICQEAAYRDQADKAYPLRQRVDEIVNTAVLRRALADYPWWRLPKMQGVFALAMKWKMVGTLICLVRLRRRIASV